MFVFAGRGEGAFVPQSVARGDSSLRVILVVPASDEERLQPYVQPGLDVLAINALSSETHGVYESLGLINSRRIAAFCCALYFNRHYGVSYAMMSDDNLAGVSVCLGAESTASWGEWFDHLAAQLVVERSVCVALPTFSNLGNRRSREGELGSKLFLLDMNRLRGRLGDDVRNWFLPFYPARATSYWGEDYYFQLVFQALFSPHYKGYQVLSPTHYGLKRAALPSLCRTVVRTAEALCETTAEALFSEGQAIFSSLQWEGFTPYDYIKQSMDKLQGLIQSNIALHQRRLQHSFTKPLLLAHAWANGLVYTPPLERPAVRDEDFLSALRQQLLFIQDKGHLHAYQKEVLLQVSANLSGTRFLGQLNLATGTGKTYVQMYLALAALLT